MPMPNLSSWWSRLAWHAAVILPAGILIGCGSIERAPATIDEGGQRASLSKPSSTTPALPPAGSGRGGYYQDDGPGDKIPDGLLATPDPEPKVEPYATRGNKPYVVFGKTYVPMVNNQAFKQRGKGSWYGKKFHGQKTSSGEIYDMYKMTAAHPTLPIPSYARVTNLTNGKQVIVRVNDRGPFHASRIIDLSYTAALKLGYLSQGSSELEVERLLPEDIARINAAKSNTANSEQAQPAPAAAPVVDASARPVMHSVSAPAPDNNQASKPPAPSEPPVAIAIPVPVVSVASSATVVPAPVAGTSTGGFYLQLGAFSQAANAESLRTQLEQKWAGVLMPTEVIAQNGLYRLYSGPFASRADAEMVAQRMHDSGAGKPLIVQK